MRRLVVFGATGGTGRALVEQALAAGHAVTAVARRPEAVTVRHPMLTVLPGDVLSPASIEPAIAGQEAVLSALGVRTRGPTTVCGAGVANILAAMTRCGVRRILCVSATGLGDGAGLSLPLRLFMRHILQPLLRHPYADMRAMEATLRASPLDWTIVRPPRLTSGPRTDRLRFAIDAPLVGATHISRADLAGFMLTNLDDPAIVRTTVEVAR
jgi:putative NADH-flavin reductase